MAKVANLFHKFTVTTASSTRADKDRTNREPKTL